MEFVLMLQACSIQFALFGVRGFHRTFRAQTGMVLPKLVTVAHDPLPLKHKPWSATCPKQKRLPAFLMAQQNLSDLKVSLSLSKSGDLCPKK